MSRLVVVGGGGHASVLASIALRDGCGELVGYLDLGPSAGIVDLPYLGTDDEPDPQAQGADLLFGIGLIENAESRWKVFQLHREAGRRFRTLVSSTATVAAEADLGEGTVVLDHAVVCAGAHIGAGSIINTGAVVEHGCRIGENTHLATGAIVCGDARIGSHCLVGAGAVVIQGVSVADSCIVGAGSVVVRDLTQVGHYLGAPARPVALEEGAGS